MVAEPRDMPLQAFVAVTDFEWYTFLTARPDLDEVNFWQPGGSKLFQALQPGEPFLFKLHSPRNFVVGGGFFVHATRLPVTLVWEMFEEKNGAASLEEMQRRIEKYRSSTPSSLEEYHIGCVLLTSPFFFEERGWIPIPADWSKNIVQGKTYSLVKGYGKRLWNDVQMRLDSGELPWEEFHEKEGPRYGKPIQVLQRLGQGIFRALVTDAYDRRCAVTGERVLPALEAAHIKPFRLAGPNQVNNGLLLRSDLHRLFDRGYLTVDLSHRLDVSQKIREQFENGRDYYALRGKLITLPRNSSDHPSKDFLRWHNERVFLS